MKQLIVWISHNKNEDDSMIELHYNNDYSCHKDGIYVDGMDILMYTKFRVENEDGEEVYNSEKSPLSIEDKLQKMMDKYGIESVDNVSSKNFSNQNIQMLSSICGKHVNQELRKKYREQLNNYFSSNNKEV